MNSQNPERDNEILKRWARGETRKQIVAAMGLSGIGVVVGVVNRASATGEARGKPKMVTRSANAPIVSRTAARPAKQEAELPERTLRMLDMRANGASHIDIANAFGTTKKAVEGIMRRARDAGDPRAFTGAVERIAAASAPAKTKPALPKTKKVSNPLGANYSGGGQNALIFSRNASAKPGVKRAPYTPKTIDAPESLSLTFEQMVDSRGCRWPTGEDAKGGHLFCGHERVPEKSYCPAHMAAAYRPETKRDRRAQSFDRAAI